MTAATTPLDAPKRKPWPWERAKKTFYTWLLGILPAIVLPALALLFGLLAFLLSPVGIAFLMADAWIIGVLASVLFTCDILAIFCLAKLSSEERKKEIGSNFWVWFKLLGFHVLGVAANVFGIWHFFSMNNIWLSNLFVGFIAPIAFSLLGFVTAFYNIRYFLDAKPGKGTMSLISAVVSSLSALVCCVGTGLIMLPWATPITLAFLCVVAGMFAFRRATANLKDNATFGQKINTVLKSPSTIVFMAAATLLATALLAGEAVIDGLITSAISLATMTTALGPLGILVCGVLTAVLAGVYIYQLYQRNSQEASNVETEPQRRAFAPAKVGPEVGETSSVTLNEEQEPTIRSLIILKAKTLIEKPGYLGLFSSSLRSDFRGDFTVLRLLATAEHATHNERLRDLFRRMVADMRPDNKVSFYMVDRDVHENEQILETLIDFAQKHVNQSAQPQIHSIS